MHRQRIIWLTCNTSYSVCNIRFESHASTKAEKSISHTVKKKIITQTSTFAFLVFKEAVLVDSLMTIHTQSTDQSAAQQLTTTTHELFTPCTADCTIKRKCCEIFDDVIQELRCPRLLLVSWLFPYQLPKSTRNTCKIANKFMTVASL